MAQTSHTPGPWTVTSVSADTGNISVGHKDQRIVIAEVTNAASFGDMLIGAMKRGGGSFQQNDCRTQFANADLIAAAPDLLEAGSAILDYATLPEILADAARHEDTVFAIRIGDLRRLSAAIAKAEGPTNA